MGGRGGTTDQLAANGGARCGARKKGGPRSGFCNLAAGWGTNHQGIGQCKLHGGSMPNNVKAAASEEFRKLLGEPYEINPLDALLWCIKIRAGEVKWLSEQMHALEEKDWIELDGFDQKQLHLWARERKSAVNDLARYSQMAVSLGIAERAVRMAEVYGETIARCIRGILDELMPYIAPDGIKLIPVIVKKHLSQMDGDVVIDDDDRRELPALAERTVAGGS